MTDAEVLASMRAVSVDGWRDLFGLDLGNPTDDLERRLIELSYELGLVVPFDWPSWYAGERYKGGSGLEVASLADTVRLITSFVRGDRFSDGALRSGLRDGALEAAIERLWSWYENEQPTGGKPVEWTDYSLDSAYRWFFERRWEPGPALCWVGLNPGTGDTDGKRRPTLDRVIGWARREGCGAVIVVNLFSFRSTDPKLLRVGGVEPVGERTDDAIRDATRRSSITLAAWGGDRAARTGRARDVYELLRSPVCVGVTKDGEPLHPLFQPADSLFVPYAR